MKTFNLFQLGLFLFTCLLSVNSEAAKKYGRVINWSETPGAVYELEVSKDEHENVILKKLLEESSYKLVFDEPGNYYWRYRIKTNRKWEPYSGYTLIKFKGAPLEDKSEKTTLMIAPQNGEEVHYKKNRAKIKFRWNEPDPNSTYHLELYFNRKKTPSRIMTVSGGELELTLKKIPEKLNWRVFRKKAGETVKVDKELYEVKLEPLRDDFKPSENFLLSIAMFQAQSAFNFESPNFKNDDSFAGQILEFNAEYFPKFWDRRRSVNFYFRNATLESSGFEVANRKFGLEYGLVVGSTPSIHQQFYIGYHFINNIELKFGDALNTDYDQSFFTGRHLYRKQFSERFSWEINSTLLIGSLSTVPSITLKPALNYLWQDDLWVSAYGMFERYLSEIDASSQSSVVNIEQATTGVGLGITWIPGK